MPNIEARVVVSKEILEAIRARTDPASALHICLDGELGGEAEVYFCPDCATAMIGQIAVSDGAEREDGTVHVAVAFDPGKCIQLSLTSQIVLVPRSALQTIRVVED